jgi:hypothetical protein
MRNKTWSAIALLAMASLVVGCGEFEEEKNFGSFDGDGDGVVSSIEWSAAGGEPSVVVDFDGNADGELSAEEFAAFQSAEGYSPCDSAACPGDQCSIGSCVGGQGACTTEALFGANCNDGDVCTTNEYCQEDGVCGVSGDGGTDGTEFCGFDENQQGKLIGDHVKNFAMKTPDSCPYWLHQSCGTGTKVIWVILSTGW